eukprot:6462450-Amphidinium_carterae.1
MSATIGSLQVHVHERRLGWTACLPIHPWCQIRPHDVRLIKGNRMIDNMDKCMSGYTLVCPGLPKVFKTKNLSQILGLANQLLNFQVFGCILAKWQDLCISRAPHTQALLVHQGRIQWECICHSCRSEAGPSPWSLTQAKHSAHDPSQFCNASMRLTAGNHH